MSSARRSADPATPSISLEGLDTEQLELVARFVDVVRSRDKERGKTEFLRFWESWKARAPQTSDEEAEAVVAEAVAFARGRA